MPKEPGLDYDPSLLQVIKDVIERRLVDVRTSVPGKIVSYDPATQKASVQIQLMRRYEDGGLVAPPVLPNVPVQWPRAAGGKAFMHMPLVAGDDVLLHFADRSLDNWKTQGGLTDPADRRKFNVTDAVATPGCSAFPQAFAPKTPDCVELANGTSYVAIHPDGKIELKGGSADDIVDIIQDFIAGIARATTITMLGPQMLIDPQDPGWTKLAQRIAAFRGGA